MLNIWNISSYAWQYLSQIEMILSLLTMSVAFGIAFIKRKTLWKWILKGHQRPKDRTKVFNEDFMIEAENCHGLILILGRVDQMEWLIEQLNPNYIHAISSKTESFRNAAISFQENQIKKGKDVQLSLIKSIENKEETKDAVMQAIERFKRHRLKTIIVDITGGTKPMSIGAYEAAKLSNTITSYISIPFQKTAKPIHGETKIIKL